MTFYPLLLLWVYQAFPLTLIIPQSQIDPPLNRLINGIALLVVVVFVIICLLAFIILLTTLLPKVSGRAKIAIVHSPWRAFFIGLANYLFLGGIGLVLLSTEVPVLSFIGLLIVAFLVIVTFIGLPGLVMRIGERLAELRGQEMSQLKQLGWGALTLEFALLLPFIGWFLLLPIVLLTSFGAGVLSWRNQKQAEWSGDLN